MMKGWSVLAGGLGFTWGANPMVADPMVADRDMMVLFRGFPSRWQAAPTPSGLLGSLVKSPPFGGEDFVMQRRSC